VKKIVPSDAVLVPDNAKKVFEGVICDVYHWPQKLFDGSETTYEMLRRPDSIDAICIVDDKIIVLDDSQPHQGTITTFPSGKVDKDDKSVFETAQREVKEETGYSFKNWNLVSVRQLNAKTEWFIYAFVAYDVIEHGETNLDAGEKIKVNLLSFEEAKKLCEIEQGYMGESRHIFDKAKSISDLKNLAQFKGKEIDR